MGDNQFFEEDIIIKVLLNEASAEEVIELEAWINENPLNRQKFLELQRIWSTLEVERSVSAEATKKDWISISQRVQQSEKFSGGKVKLLVSNISKIAAMLLIGSVGYFISSLLKDAVSSQSYTSITVPNGSKTEILLPDGSNVILNAGSTLRYPEQFTNDQQEVYLEGEAFFHVKHNADQQFLVKTKEITIKVYGTSFNVMSYNDGLATETTLEEGRIGITVNSDKSKNKKEVWIEPNQQAVWYHANSSPQQEIKILKEIDVQIYTAWKEGVLIIKSEALKDLAVKLERRYGVKILFGNEEVKAIKFTGTIKNETVEQVMQLIKLVSNIEYSIKENVITIGKQK
jgi:transmembrane sensor